MEATSTETGTELAGSIPLFPKRPGEKLSAALWLPDFRRKRLIFNEFEQTQRVHVYQADCRAGERLRVQMFYPVLRRGRSARARFAVIAQSLPYSADPQALPIAMPAGFRAVVAPQMNAWTVPNVDMLTRAEYYPGPVIDTQSLVSGRCYIVVWTPDERPGRYVLHVGHRWPLRGSYWMQIPIYWWQIRGWFGLTRAAAYALVGGLLLGVIGAWILSKRARWGSAAERVA